MERASEKITDKIYRYFNKNYCPNCKQKINPSIPTQYLIFDIFLFPILVIGLIYLADSLFSIVLTLWDSITIAVIFIFLGLLSPVNKRCPICGCEYKDLEYRN